MEWYQQAIMEYKRKRSISCRDYPPFFTSAYIMDVICFGSQFPIIGWKWIFQDPLPIHLYHKSMWEYQFFPYFYKIYQGFMLAIHKKVYNRNTPIFSREAKVDILHIAKWFGEETFTYIRVFESTASPHLLRYYVLDKLMAKEIAYKTTRDGGLSKVLKE